MNVREDRLRKLLIHHISSFTGGYNLVEIMMPDGWIVQTKGEWYDKFAWVEEKLNSLKIEELDTISDFIFKYEESCEGNNYVEQVKGFDFCGKSIAKYFEQIGLLPSAKETRKRKAAQEIARVAP